MVFFNNFSIRPKSEASGKGIGYECDFSIQYLLYYNLYFFFILHLDTLKIIFIFFSKLFGW